ncbi:hypothetical protein K6025_04905 [Ehrlichia sp. JZT12]
MKEPGYIALVSLLILLVVAMIIFGVFAGDMYKLHQQGKRLWLQDEESQSKKKVDLREYSDTEVQSAIDELGKGIAEITHWEEQFSSLKNVVEETIASEVLRSPDGIDSPYSKECNKNLSDKQYAVSPLTLRLNSDQPAGKVASSNADLLQKVRKNTSTKTMYKKLK